MTCRQSNVVIIIGCIFCGFFFIIFAILSVYLVNSKYDTSKRFDSKVSETKYGSFYLEKCPCKYQTLDDDSDNLSYEHTSDKIYILVCFLWSVHKYDADRFDNSNFHNRNYTWQNIYGINTLNIYFRMISDLSFFNVKGCDIVLSILKDNENTMPSIDLNYMLWACPGICHPMPKVAIPTTLIRFIENLSNWNSSGKDNDMYITCSLTISSLSQLFKANAFEQTKNQLSFAFTIIVLHKLSECMERVPWSHPRSRSAVPSSEGHKSAQLLKRPIEYVIIWIASNTRINLVQDQWLSVTKSNLSLSTTIVWVATEDVYPCRPGSTICSKAPINTDYFKYLDAFPGSWINQEKYIRRPGWACAQRRPLRALAHVLRLFDASLLAILDDDAYLNFKLLTSRVAPYLRSVDSASRPVVLAQQAAGTKNVAGVMMLGGAGYVIGRHAMLRLVKHSILSSFPAWHNNRFGFFSELVSVTAAVCTQPCIGEGVNGTDEVSITIPLIDLCANFLSGEHTCHHRYVQRIPCLT